jgi:hypothetical protein
LIETFSKRVGCQFISEGLTYVEPPMVGTSPGGLSRTALIVAPSLGHATGIIAVNRGRAQGAEAAGRRSALDFGSSMAIRQYLPSYPKYFRKLVERRPLSRGGKCGFTVSTPFETALRASSG